MVTLCTNQQVLDRCGKRADATIIASSSFLDRYIEAAEKVVISETMIDWIDDYSSVDTYV
jgi:hypothetical protein